ncbi:dihydropteroate synthase [Aequitasia blattaphilus]|uniref:Dihydropteroate synthase n=1 Tax=Aequitasia blattaphilus TaxID=2949332 RepID=A0ABT1EAG4_9FIRM|nr:dihydropteroate synthase [Aequitasia blattaphilus]MCP1102818.1 dihydropteroate synthase [Aequitasia blattaphilus]MCR8615458.1 dihydropteroate synthase [Aequitasia blattaphilus]
MQIGKHDFKTDDTYIMGILNVTPNSFSDGGKYNQQDSALFHVEEMIKDGMDIVDIGGESTKPGYVKISDDEEISRIAPVIEAVKKRFDIPISVDTYKSKVAHAAALAGADLINDIWGLKYDAQMAKVIADCDLPCCLMHNRNIEEQSYTDFLQDVKKDLEESIELASLAGIKKEKIILDPGVGFAKTREENLKIMKNLNLLKDMGYPVLLGVSKKSVIGLTLDVPLNERLEGTIATTVFGVINHATFIRVHDVKENKRAVLMTQAILRA